MRNDLVRMKGRAQSRNAQILVVDDDPDMRDLLKDELEDEGFRVQTADGGRAALARAAKGDIDLIVSDVRMPDLDGIGLLRELNAAPFRPSVITITAFGSIDTAIRAVKLGAYDYITKPFEMSTLLGTIDKALVEEPMTAAVSSGRSNQIQSVPQNRHAEHSSPKLADDNPAPGVSHPGADAKPRGIQLAKPPGPITENPSASSQPRSSTSEEQVRDIVARSSSMKELVAYVHRTREANANVLITGEPGCGKGLVARAIHEGSDRASGPFLKFDCGGLTPSRLAEDFLGPNGLIRTTENATFFFDDVAELPLAAQPEFLRMLREGNLAVRFIAATQHNLRTAVRAGTFREDLFYRLDILALHVPALRQRRDDILALAEHFLNQARRGSPDRARGFDEGARNLLMRYTFPGNVRELKSVAQRAAALCKGPMVTAAELPTSFRDEKNQDRLDRALDRGMTVGELEREYILRVLASEGGNKTRTAARLGLDRKTLYRKLEEYAAQEREPTRPEA